MHICWITYSYYSVAVLLGISNNHLTPTFIPQHCLINPHALLFCSFPFHTGIYDCWHRMFFRAYPCPWPHHISYHRYAHLCLGHVPKFFLWQILRKRCTVSRALRLLAAGHVTKGRTLRELVFLPSPS